MTRNRRASGVVARVIAFALVAASAPGFAGSAAGEAAVPSVDHSDFDALLARYVDPVGVRWEAWNNTDEDRQALRSYIDRMAAVSPSALSDDARLAYWINLYNALTVDLVLGKYPVDSIKDLGGFFGSPWKKDLVVVGGEKLTLNKIENDIIRPEFGEPRIHFALNCAAVSCPPLRAEAYVGERLDAQLEEQTHAFLGDAGRNGFDEKGKLRLSKILDWYRDDFENGGSLLEWVRPYVPELAGRDPADPVEIGFRGYEWDLNEAAATVSE